MLAAETKAVGGSHAAPAPDSTRSWAQIVEPVEPFLESVAQRLSEQVQSFDPQIAPYAQYALTNQGKQLRPALVCLSGGAAGRVNDNLVTVAVIIEMVHLATLVHDDVVDEAEIRRCRPTLAANWGNEISVLLGDCLFANALKLAASFPTPEVCRAVSGATHTVCAGEILQTLRRGDFQFSRADYFKILEMKTAALFALSCDLGASLAGGSAEQRSALRQFGLMLGTAYQIFDDCVDLFGSESLAGKSLGTDLTGGKVTLPILVVLERASVVDRAELEHLIGRWERRHLPKVFRLLERYNAYRESRVSIHQFLKAARNSLASLRPSSSLAALYGLADFLAQQTDALGVPS